MKILGIGDNVVDRHFDDGMMYIGGNSLNFAVYGGQMSYASAYAGVVAKDSYGDWVLDILKGQGVDVSHCVRKEGETGLCTIRLTDGDRSISEDNHGGVVYEQPLEITEELLAYASGFDVIHTGYLAYMDHEIPKLQGLDVPVVYDFCDTWDDDSFRRNCPSVDFAFFSGKKLSEAEIVGYLEKTIEYGSSLGICTIGKRGAVVFDGRDIYRKKPYNLDLEVIDTTGAGDAFITGFTTTYTAGRQLFEQISGDKEPFHTPADREDYDRALMERALSVANLMAIRTCMVVGAFGQGKPMV